MNNSCIHSGKEWLGLGPCPFCKIEVVTNQSLIDKINKEQQEANELRIKLECMRQSYIALISCHHDIGLTNQHSLHRNTWDKCGATACNSARDVLYKLGLRW